MSSERLWTMVPRLPWRIAVNRARPAVYRNATPILCLPDLSAPQRQALRAQGSEVWWFDFLGSGESDPCLPGHEPDRLRQIAAVVALIQAVSGASRLALAASDLAPARQFADNYPFAIEHLMQGDENEPGDRRDFRGAAA
jgi:hypothetical protein